jgi:hypothetical protein
MNVYGTNVAGTVQSNTKVIVDVGDQPIAAAATDFVFALDQQTGKMYEFNAADGSPIATTFNSIVNNHGGIAIDTNADGTTDFVVVNEDNGGLFWFVPDGSTGGGAVDYSGTATQRAVGVTADSHRACTTEPADKRGWCEAMASGPAITVSHFFTAGVQPQALGMGHGCGSSTLFTLDVAGNATTATPTLFSHAIAADGTATPLNSLLLPEFTSATKFSAAQILHNVHWQVAAANSSCTVYVLGSVLNLDGSVGYTLALVNGSTMTKLAPSIVLPAGSTKILADNVNDVVLAFAPDVSGVQGEVRAYRCDKTGKLTNVTSTIPIVYPVTATPLTVWPAGAVLSPTGANIYSLGWDPANPAAGLVLKSVPNN